MIMSTNSIGSVSNRAFPPSEIRRIVELGKRRGLIRGAGIAGAVEKDGLAAAALGNVRSQWAEVTPQMAKRWLENNFRNRPLDQDTVTAYARDMTIGNWAPTHQGIAFNDRDELIDGQHRLHAIASSGKTIRIMVTFGLPSTIEGKEMTTMDCVDRGRTRSVADQLRIQHGLANGSAISMIANYLSQLCCGERTRRMSVGHALEVYRLFQPETDWIIEHRSKDPGLRMGGVLSAFALALASEAGGSVRIAKMHELLLSGDLDPRSPIALLRTFLLSDEAKLITQRLNRGVAELTLQALYLESKGKRVEKLEMSLDGADHYRAACKARVAKIAEIFRLPKSGTEPV
jgi:hypothetical protein